jgi:YHS domain-containing protein
VAPAHFEWDYTTVLNFIFLALFGLLYWTYRNRERLGGGSGYALDPVCGMQVETANAPASVPHEGHLVYFCSDHCRNRFEADPTRFAKVHATADGDDGGSMGMGAMPPPSAGDPDRGATHVDPA